MYRPRVLIVDDHAIVREAFQKLIEPECEVVGCLANGRALVEAAPKLKPDVIVLDIAMPLLNGLDAGHQLKRFMPIVKLIFLTVNEDPDVIREAFRLGASGFLLKRSAASELFHAIQEVLRGKTYITPLLTQGMADSCLPKLPRRKTPETLTLRQREVLQLIVEGYSMKEIAAALQVTARTVAFHKYRLMEELRLKNSTELIRFAIKHDLAFTSCC